MIVIVEMTADALDFEPLIAPRDCDLFATLPADGDLRFRRELGDPSTEFVLPAGAQEMVAAEWHNQHGRDPQPYRFLTGQVLYYVAAVAGVVTFRVKFLR